MKVDVIDESNIKHWRTELPNTVVRGKNSSLSVYAKWLYVYLKSVAGENGKCWQGTKTIAKGSGISAGKVSDCKKELVKAGLISIDKGNVKNGTSDVIRIKDIWASNILEFQREHPPSPHEHPPSPGERPPSCDEHPPSPHEPKKNPIKKEPYKKGAREKGSVVSAINSAETKADLLKIWEAYRKEKGKHMTMYERDVILNSTWLNKSIHEIKKTLLHTIDKGWLNLHKPDEEETTQKVMDGGTW